MSYEVLILRKSEFEKFLKKLDNGSKSRLARDISFLKEYGKDLQMPYAKKVDRELWELRTSGKQRVRIFYTIRGFQIYIIHWFVKKSKKLPLQELQTALRRLTDI